MAKKKTAEADDSVTVIAGSRFLHDGQAINHGDVLRMDRAQADDLLAMRFVRLPKPGEVVT